MLHQSHLSSQPRGTPLSLKQTRWMCGTRPRSQSASRALSAASSMATKTCWRPSSRVGQGPVLLHAQPSADELCASSAVVLVGRAGRGGRFPR